MIKCYLYNPIQAYMMQKAATRKTRAVYPISLGDEDNKLLEKLSERTGTSKAQAIRDAIRAYADEVQGLEVVKSARSS